MFPRVQCVVNPLKKAKSAFRTASASPGEPANPYVPACDRRASENLAALLQRPRTERAVNKQTRWTVERARGARSRQEGEAPQLSGPKLAGNGSAWTNRATFAHFSPRLFGVGQQGTPQNSKWGEECAQPQHRLPSWSTPTGQRAKRESTVLEVSSTVSLSAL